MADLSSLIRLHKHELDAKRQILSRLYFAHAELERERRALEQAFEREKENLEAMGEVHFTFAGYAERVRQQREQIEAKEKLLEQEIVKAKDSLMETFSEMKKYEMTQEERLRLEEEARRLKESKTMDEIGLETFRRGEKS